MTFTRTNADADKWNGRYQRDGDKWQTYSPRQLLLDYAHLLPSSGLALDAAAGVGIHCRFLAERGWRVIALDISEVGLRLAKEMAAREHLWLEAAVMDLSRLWLPANRFDLILNFRFLERATFAAYRRALKPGGWLIFETFVQGNGRSPKPNFYLEPGELAAAFADFDVLYSAERLVRGQHSGKSKLAAQLVARKPVTAAGAAENPG
jgi:SAM-dependent methyltransferase